MAYNIEIQDTARNEVDNILEYFSSISERAKSNFYSDFKKCIKSLEAGVVDYRLSRFPNIASADYHAVYFNNYVLLYFQNENTRTIAHVFHQIQNYADLI